MTERTEKAENLLFKDPDLPWPSDFPYDRLNRRLRESGRPGLDPSSTSQHIKDALFDLMSKGPVSPEDRLAWDELRLLERRLLLDFLLYTFEPAGGEVWSDALWELPMPLQMPDFRELANDEPDYENIISLPSSFDTSSAPGPARIDAELLAGGAVDIGPVTLNLAKIFGEPYAE